MTAQTSLVLSAGREEKSPATPVGKVQITWWATFTDIGLSSMSHRNAGMHSLMVSCNLKHQTST